MALLPQQETINQYVGDGIEPVFEYTYLVPTDRDIDIYVTPPNQSANEDADIQPLGVAYTVQNTGVLEGGTVTFLPGFIPANGSTVTLDRNVKASIETNYAEPKTIIGENLDDSFEREMLVIQQNKTDNDLRSLRYEKSSFVPDTTDRNVVPLLEEGFIWKGSAAGGVVAAFQEEDPDCSTLRSELESKTQGSDGAGLVGYFDESRLLETTVRDQLNNYGSATQGADGASLIGYFDEAESKETTVAAVLSQLEATLFPSGSRRTKFVEIVDPGWALCDGASYDMVGDNATGETIRLGNTILADGKLGVYGVGLDSYFTFLPLSDVAEHVAIEEGVAGAPDAHASGFSIVVTQVGAPGVQQKVQVTTNPGNTIPPGSYYEIKAPSGRSAFFWFEVDGGGTAPLFPSDLVSMVSILSTDTADQVADAILASSFLQYRVPKVDGRFFRAFDNGSGVDPDAASRTNIDGSVVGDVVGSLQDDALQDHTHTYLAADVAPASQSGPNFNQNNTSLETSPPNGANISTETRPVSMSIFTLIKF